MTNLRMIRNSGHCVDIYNKAMPLGAKVIDCGPRSDAEKNATEMSAVNKMMPNAEGGVPETVECFLSDITLHGVRYLFAKSTLRRFLWSLALLASLGYCYYQTYQSSMQYLRRPFNTKITSKSANYTWARLFKR